MHRFFVGVVVYECNGALYYGILAALPVGRGDVLLYVWRNAKFGVLPGCVEYGAGRKTYRPAVGQGAVERQPRAAACCVAQHNYLWQGF